MIDAEAGWMLLTLAALLGGIYAGWRLRTLHPGPIELAGCAKCRTIHVAPGREDCPSCGRTLNVHVVVPGACLGTDVE